MQAPCRVHQDHIGLSRAGGVHGIEHHGGDAVIIPNGVETAAFRSAQPLEQWVGTDERPVIVFLGRLDEPRKGLSIFVGAIERVLADNGWQTGVDRFLKSVGSSAAD